MPLYEYYLKFDYAEEPLNLMSALFDPNVGPQFLDTLTNELREKAMNEVLEHIAQQPSPPPPSSDNLPSFLQAHARRSSLGPRGDAASARKELNDLMIEIHLAQRNSTDGKIDPIKFYTVGTGAKFPAFVPLALEMFTIAAGEAACERMFSAAGYFDAPRRDWKASTLAKMTLCKYYPNIK